MLSSARGPSARRPRTARSSRSARSGARPTASATAPTIAATCRSRSARYPARVLRIKCGSCRSRATDRRTCDAPRVRWTLLLAVAACQPLPPPPAIPLHAGTQADREGTTTAMLVVGCAGELLGGGGCGAGVRVERQASERTAVGLELTGGYGERAEYEDGEMFRHWLVAIRAYGRFSPAGDHSVALGYGLGFGVMATGAFIATLHAGYAFGQGDGGVEPVGGLSFAIAAPLLRGRAFRTA